MSFAKQPETIEDILALFSLMDTQNEKDDQITFDEFKKAWLQWDTNGDETFSLDELNAVLQKLNFGRSGMAEYLFLDLKLAELKEWFELVDSNLDGAIVLSEYVNPLNDYDANEKIKQ
ncbi:hypothetical protein ACJMK2_038475 [Sinanodonta woodiana]|uniref:EF-hand domain-containing protein n=1 Tax=Sinanodonta woodiana TaxID=1069815 RepID=A0ABD3W8V9_SINWO